MMHENVGYNTELIANYCYKGLSHNALGSTGVNLFPSCSQHYCALVNFVVRTGQILTMVLVHHFGLKYVRDTHLSETEALLCVQLQVVLYMLFHNMSTVFFKYCDVWPGHI